MNKKILVCGGLYSSLQNFRGPLLRALSSKGLDVHVAAPILENDHGTYEWLSSQNIKSHNITLIRAGLNPISDLNTLSSLVRLIKKIKPNYFLGYTIKPVVWGMISAWLLRVPNRIALITGLGYAFTGTVTGKRALIQKIARALYRFSLKRSTLIFFQNPDDKCDFERYGILPKDIAVEVVNGSGVDVRQFANRSIPEGPISFLLIARLLGDKGIREYVAAARRIRETHPHVTFHLVGGLDPNPDSITETDVTGWHSAGDIFWHGELADVKPMIVQTHVYVLPSYREGTPRTVLEAMSIGRPIITTDAPGCKETVVEGENGFKVPVREVEPLVNAMYKFINSPELIEVMGKKSRQIAEEKYDVEKVNQEMLKAMGIK